MSEKGKPLPPLELLQEKFTYDPAEGVLRWRDPPNDRRYRPPGSPAGSSNIRGYLSVKMAGRSTYKVHRICFKLGHGRDPLGMIDHRNGVKTDNRLDNLRETLYRGNNANAATRSDNTSGIKGISAYARDRWPRWKAQWCQPDGKRKSKYFPYTPEGLVAAEQFIKAKRRELYGEFANDGEHRDAAV